MDVAIDLVPRLRTNWSLINTCNQGDETRNYINSHNTGY